MSGDAKQCEMQSGAIRCRLSAGHEGAHEPAWPPETPDPDQVHILVPVDDCFRVGGRVHTGIPVQHAVDALRARSWTCEPPPDAPGEPGDER